MKKINKSPIIRNCYACDYSRHNNQINKQECWADSSVDPFDVTKNIASIHPDCPLADVDVCIPDPKGKIGVIGMDGEYRNYNTAEIEKIIIVKKKEAV